MLNRVLRAGMAVLVLTGVSSMAACGERDRPEQPTASPAADGVGLTQPQLERAAVTKQDLPGYTVDAISTSVSAPSLPAKPAECQAIGDTLGMVSQYRPTARLGRVVSKPGEGTAGLGLAAYRAGDAKKVMADVRAGISTCVGKAFDDAGDPFRYEAVTALPDPGKGDESVSFKLVQVVEDSKARSEVSLVYVLVRSGSTVATFRALGFGGRAAAVPADAVDAQVRKLAIAA
ncbi:hypothetical protein ACFYXH_10705 [Streptomyces sp. NPDC002730]|uniref:hypothetical protein n=1 Tax=Streptomyces sp. NPDC002730 TaxID=3364662 RepID=UPI0036CB1898